MVLLEGPSGQTRGRLQGTVQDGTYTLQNAHNGVYLKVDDTMGAQTSDDTSHWLLQAAVEKHTTMLDGPGRMEPGETEDQGRNLEG